MQTMKAVLVKQPGGVDQLYFGETEKPSPGPKELLVKVKCFALNRMDIVQREGKYPLPPQAGPILGVEMAGTVVGAGPETKKFAVGDKVFGLMYGGAYAEYATIDEDSAIPLGPLSMEFGSSLLECWYTAYQAVHLIGNIKRGDDILIHAAAGGVGTAAIQLAKFAGARRIFVTAGSQAKLDYCKNLGATHLINYHDESFKDAVLRDTDGRGVDIICDFILAKYFNDNVASLARDGRMSLQGAMGGSVVENANMGLVLFKRLHIEGSTLRSRSLEYQRSLSSHFRSEILPHVISGEVKWHIEKVFSWEDIKDAHRMMEEAKFVGKIVVEIPDIE